jgi:peptide-methionine (R)-S-oxide reductase
MTTRRLFLISTAGLAVAACTPAQSQATDIPSAANEARYAADPFRRLTPAQWRTRLSPAAYRVLREEGTERAGTSPLEHESRRGMFHCAGCDLPLFDSRWKFDSGTGWPSFSRIIIENAGTKEDFLLLQPRTEYHCARCLGHQGHVFPDGPRPTGLRYCNNGVALRFVAA